MSDILKSVNLSGHDVQVTQWDDGRAELTLSAMAGKSRCTMSLRLSAADWRALADAALDAAAHCDGGPDRLAAALAEARRQAGEDV